MRHHEDGAVLHVGGRLCDRDETQFELRRERQRWELVGEFTGLSLTQRQTLDALRAHNRLTPTQGADIWGGSRQAAHKRLDGLCQLGVAFAKDGTYYPK
jgi:hypothetical protein